MTKPEGVLKAKVNPRLTFEQVEREIRGRNYGILCTSAKDGRPHGVGVMYAVSLADEPLALNLVTDRRSKKARNIARKPDVAFVIPIHRSPGFLPPSSIQFQGKALLLPPTDTECRQAFESSWVMRRVLKLQLEQKGEVSVFVRIHPDPVILTYGVGLSLLQLMRHLEGSSARIEIPASRM